MNHFFLEENENGDLIAKQARRFLVKAKFVDRKDFPTKTVCSCQTKNLPRKLIIGATFILVKILGLHKGSGDKFDIYELLLAYLQDDQARSDLNRVVHEADLRKIRAMSAERDRAWLAEEAAIAISQV